MPVVLVGLISCLLMMASSASRAMDYALSGFASFGVGKVFEDRVYFQEYDSDGWSSDTDNVLGLQLQAFLADRLSLTVQGIVRGDSYDEGLSQYEPELDWLFLGYEISPQLRTRLGRLRTPHYLYSETMEVGYSYVWVRPPVDVYTPLLSPLRNFDGIDFTFTNDFWSDALESDVYFETQLFGGLLEGHFLGNDIKVDPAIGLNVVTTLDQLKMRYGLIIMKSDILNRELDQLRPYLYEASQVSAPLADAADSLIAEGEWYQYHGYGFSWDTDDWNLSAEQYFILPSDKGFSNDARGYYLSYAYHLGAITPYVVYGRYRNRFDSSLERNILASYDDVPRSLNPQLDGIRDAVLFGYEAVNVVEKTYTVGFRWDIMPRLALKAEFQHFRFSDDSSGHMLAETDGLHAKAANMTSLVLDVVF